MLSRKDFLKVYIPMARGGHSANDIAGVLGIEGENAGKKVSIKASQIRGAVKKAAEKAGQTVAEDAGVPFLTTQDRESILDLVSGFAETESESETDTSESETDTSESETDTSDPESEG